MRKSRLLGARCAYILLLSLFSLPASAATVNIDYNVSVAGNYNGLTYNVDAGDILHFTNTSGSYFVRIESYLTTFAALDGPDGFDSGVFAPGNTYDHLVVGPGDFQLATAFWQTTAAQSTARAFQDVIVTPSSVPVPAAVWLFGSGLIGLVGIARKRKTT